MAKCPYCHNDKTREDRFHAGTCENCGGRLEAEGEPLTYYSQHSYITQEQLEDCIAPYYMINFTASGEVTNEVIELLKLEFHNATAMD